MDAISILWAVVIIVGIALLMAVLLAIASKYLKVKEDPRQEEAMKLLPNANCGGCGFPGCAGLASALIGGEETHIRRCIVIKEEEAKKLVDYLNSTSDSEGHTLKVDL